MRYSPGTLIVQARFVGLHASMLRALLAYGLDEAAALGLIDVAAMAGKHEVRFVVGPTAAHPEARTVIVRRMRGNHAEAWEERAAPLGPCVTGKTTAT